MTGGVRRPTLADVGRRAGVDASIASRVLGGELNRVTPETRERILASAKELGWRPHPGARSLRKGTTSTIAVIIPSLNNPAYGSMIQGAQSAAARADHVVVFADTDNDIHRAASEIERLSDYVDGIVLASARAGEDARIALGEAKVPVVLLNRRGAGGHPAVIGREEDGAALAARYLVSLGHRRIAVVSGTRPVDTAVRRVAGFTKELESRGLMLEPRLAVEALLTVEDAEAALAPLLRLPVGERPTGVFAAGLSAALGSLQAARKAGLNVPNDLSIVGFDDAQVAELVTPALTTIRMPHRSMGEQAVELLVRVLRGEEVPVTTVVEEAPELIIRGSTLPLHQQPRKGRK